jgi:hypothetical protein
MRAWYCATVLLVSLARANGEQDRTQQTLAILFQFERPHANRTLLETQRELEVLTKGAAVRLEWYDRGGPQAGSSYPNILVLDFLGNCDPRSETTFTGPVDGWLARLHVSDGIVLPFGEVNCDLVRALLNDGTSKHRPNDRVFGRALARVLAHELYHFIANTTEHLERGLAKPSFSREDLTLGGFKLDPHELDRLSKTTLQ